MEHRESSGPIVVGIDGSQAALNAAVWAVPEAVSRDVPLRLVHVIPFETARPGGLASVGMERQYGETALHAASAAVAATGRPVKVDTEVLLGEVDPTLIGESAAAAMLCVGSVGIGFLARTVLGSTAAALAERAHCPVAIIRTPLQAAAHDSDSIVVAIEETPADFAVVEHAFDEARLSRRTHPRSRRVAGRPPRDHLGLAGLQGTSLAGAPSRRAGPPGTGTARHRALPGRNQQGGNSIGRAS